MATTLMCRVGRHAWKHKVNDEARPYKECARAGSARSSRVARATVTCCPSSAETA